MKSLFFCLETSEEFRWSDKKSFYIQDWQKPWSEGPRGTETGRTAFWFCPCIPENLVNSKQEFAQILLPLFQTSEKEEILCRWENSEFQFPEFNFFSPI